MRTLELTAHVDEQRQLTVSLPDAFLPGPVRLLVFAPEPADDDVETVWMNGVAREWAAELADEREDLYTLEDGEPVDAPR